MSAGRQVRRVARAAARRLGLLPLAWRVEELRRAYSHPRGPSADEYGVPIPGRYLRTLVTGQADADYFLNAGAETFAHFEDLLQVHGASFANCERVLDFGCGCGRLARRLPRYSGAELVGRDLNPRLVNWCRRNLPGDFAVNALTPPLDLPDGHVDVVYALSVFTHLREDTQAAWIDEFARVLKPGGHALVSFHDDHQLGVDPAFLADVRRDGFALRIDAGEGSNLMASYQTAHHIGQTFGRRFEVLQTEPSDATPFQQAVAVLRKPASA